MTHRSSLLFLLKQNQSFLHLKNVICPVLLREYQEINPTAMCSSLFWLCVCVCFWATRPEESGKEETPFPAQGAAHGAQMPRRPRWQKQASSVFLLQLQSRLEARTCLQGTTELQEP